MARRRNSWGWGGYFKHTTTWEIEQSAQKAVKEAKKKGQEYHPVQITGTKIAKTWWGSSWCSNLERYADYVNRLPRGRTYVRHGAVVDLQLGKGEAHAKVQGSSLYKVDIQIDRLDPAKEKELGKACSDQIQNVEELLSGKFPATLKERFFAKGALFPSPKEIHFHCSCPDWATMCKHVAAVMYGIGARLDDDPLKFFDLRGIQTDEFVAKAVSNKVESMLQNAAKKSDRILDDDQLEGLFGLELGGPMAGLPEETQIRKVTDDNSSLPDRSAEQSGSKRGRGRTPKEKTVSAVNAKAQRAVAGKQPPETGEKLQKRGRGRPRKESMIPEAPGYQTIIDGYGYAEKIKENLLLLCRTLQSETFGNARVIQILDCSAPTATAYIKRLHEELNLIVPVYGQGKGKYCFRQG